MKPLIVIAYSVFTLLVTNCTYAQQDLNSIYQQKSYAMLDTFIVSKSNANPALTKNDQLTNLDSVISAFLIGYTNQLKRDLEIGRIGASWSPKYILMQPEVVIYTIEKIDLSAIKNQERSQEFKGKVLSHSPFEYYDFKGLTDSASHKYQIKGGDFSGYTPLVSDQKFLNQVNEYLHSYPKSKEHKKRADFLSKSLKIDAIGGQVRLSPEKYKVYYHFYMERIIFNKEHTIAFLQYDEGPNNAEAVIKKIDGNWVFDAKWMLTTW